MLGTHLFPALNTKIAHFLSNNVTQLFGTLFVGCFWSAMISYVSLGLLKLYGIARPLQYRRYMTVKRCVKFIVLRFVFVTNKNKTDVENTLNFLQIKF